MTPRKVNLIQSPTPLHRLDRLSDRLGVDLWIKRDDMTGFAFGGNKGRKLEYLMADIVDSGAHTVVTCGSLQSNFIRHLATACSMFGIRCAAAMMACPYEFEPPDVQPMKATGGNELLDRIVGLDIRLYEDGHWDFLIEEADKLADEYESKGGCVYRMPIGGSSPLGAFAFVQAAEELKRQMEAPFDAIVFASSSGSTHTGLAHGFRGTPTVIRGVACDPEPAIAEDFAKLSEGVVQFVGGEPMRPHDYDLDFRFIGPGYGVPSEGSLRAIETLAQAEGVFLDPVYSGKAFDGLLSMIERGEVGGRVLFWHTGGLPALFAMP
jgi:D-cysteine desulfhydrase family pyridoxal phosphate-dependent enzyme